MNKVSLTVDPRTEHGKQAAKRLRRSGWVPAVLYGTGEPPVSIKTEAKTMARALRDAHLTSIVDVTLNGGGTYQALFREPVYHPITDELLHVDLMRVSATSRVRLPVPIELVGASKGVQAGGTLDHVLHTLEIECQAMSIPEHVTVDVSALEIGDHVSVRSLDLLGIRVLTDPDSTIATVSAPRVVEEVVEAKPEGEEEVAAEPEVIGRKKEEEEEEEAAEEGEKESK